MNRRTGALIATFAWSLDGCSADDCSDGDCGETEGGDDDPGEDSGTEPSPPEPPFLTADVTSESVLPYSFEADDIFAGVNQGGFAVAGSDDYTGAFGSVRSSGRVS